MRKLVALMAAAVMLVAFCAGASAATQVTIWHTFTDAQQAALEKFAADFNASQSDYEVVVESQAYSGFLGQRLQRRGEWRWPEHDHQLCVYCCRLCEGRPCCRSEQVCL